MASNQLLPQTDKYFRIIFLISSLCGFFPYLLKNNNFKKVLLLCFFVVTVFSLSVAYVIYSFYVVIIVSTVRIGLLFKALLIPLFTMMSMVTLVGIATSPSRALAINKILHSLREFDRLSCAKNHWRTRRSDWKERNIVGTACLLLYIAYYHYFSRFFIVHLNGINYFFLSVSVYLSASQFSATALLIRKRLSSLNYFMKRIRMDCNISLAVIEIKHLVYLHNQMCDVAMILNESFKGLLTVHIASAFIVTVIVIFYMIISPSELNLLPNKSIGDSVQKIRIIIAILFFSTVLQICTCSRKISKKINRFNSLLYRFMIKDMTKKLQNEEQLVLQVTAKREVVFTACGFLRLDYSLIHSMVAAVTSYIIMLKQFYVPR